MINFKTNTFIPNTGWSTALSNIQSVWIKPVYAIWPFKIRPDHTVLDDPNKILPEFYKQSVQQRSPCRIIRQRSCNDWPVIKKLLHYVDNISQRNTGWCRNSGRKQTKDIFCSLTCFLSVWPLPLWLSPGFHVIL